MTSSRRPVIFTHILKTGGMSLRELLYQGACAAGLDATRIHVPGYGGTPGILERFEPSLELLRRRAPAWLRLPSSPVHRNRGVYTGSALPPRARELIAERFRSGTQVYQAALGRLEQELAASRPR